MKKSAKQFGIYLPILFLILTAATVLRTVACFTELNYATGYFNGKVCIRIADWLTVAACLIAFSYLFFGKSNNPRIRFGGIATYIPAGAVSVALILLSADMLSSVRSSGGFVTALSELNLFILLEILTALLALFCVLNFFFSVFYEKKENTTRAAFGIVTALFLAAYAAYLYFNTALPINAPNKTVDQMAYLFSALFFIYETRISLGRGKWRPYVAFGLIAAILTAYSALPTLIVYFAKGEMISDSVAASLLTLMIFAFITARVLIFAFCGEDEPCGTVRIITVMADNRSRQMEELSDSSHAREDNNVENSENIGSNYEIQLPEPSVSEAPEEENEEKEI